MISFVTSLASILGVVALYLREKIKEKNIQ
jgi:hypothetical protein